MHRFNVRTSFRRMKIQFLALLLLVALLLQTACGTLLHPERRGQTGGHIDPGIAILDGIGLLFFIIPGLIAFAIDFSNGTIYLPEDETADADTEVIRMAPDNMTRERIAAVISERTGKDITLTEADMRVLRSGDMTPIREQLARLNAAQEETAQE